MNADEAMAFVLEHGIVLVSAKGPVPRLTEVIAGEPIRGSWWAHPKSHQIFGVLRELGDSRDILMCRLVSGRVTFVHRRLWPALVRLANRFDRDRLAQISEEHTPSGRHVSRAVAYPRWVPARVVEEAQRLTEQQASMLLGVVARAAPKSVRPKRAIGAARRC